MKTRSQTIALVSLTAVVLMSLPLQAEGPMEIKAYCLDFNWGSGGPNKFAEPGLWADADPAKHVAWYKAMGVNVIQTFCVSCNGYAWYKNGVVPEQPGLKHDFLPEMVRLGHAEGMLVMGYFCIGANTKWGQDYPGLSYGYPSAYHIPYTDEYLAYLSTAIGDAVRKTGIDGFMIDWVWQPKRESTKGKWLECEKKLYAQLMDEQFPGEDALSEEQKVAYGRKSIDRCWKTIRAAAKKANPNCIIWLTSNDTMHPHVVNSDMYKEADWLMNEAGDLKRVNAVKPMVGKHTRLITCLARWNRQDATKVVPASLKAGVGLYGFAKPGTDSLLPLEQMLARPVSELKGDERNIAVLARAYHGVSTDSVRNDQGEFEETRPRETVQLDFDWRFYFDEIYNDADAEPPLKTGLQGAEAPDFDDNAWRFVNIPHDWAIEGDYDPTHPTRANSGYVQAGIGWYRKVIDVPETWQDKRVWLEFDGVFRNSTVWVNGRKMGRRPYGWISFGYDISNAIRNKEKAVIAVHVDNSQQNAARWYTGSGIYAPVRVVVTDKTHIKPWGVQIVASLSDDHKEASVEITTGIGGQKTNLRNTIIGPDGTPRASVTIDNVWGRTAQTLILPEPELWSCETPALYTAVSELLREDKVIDRVETRFGIRKIEWKTKTGFWLNGKNVKLKGVCNHQDAGPLGAAVPDKVLRMRLQQLKDMGCNAFRTAHNPQTPVFYDMCDEMGILVMDEIFDGWKRKAPADYGAYDFETWWGKDVGDWIRRDRNHPSIIIWSLGNETRRNDGPIAEWMVENCHKLDTTRPVTSGSADSYAMDVHGENGRSESMGFPEQHAKKLDKPFVATEYPHTWQVRGFYNTKTWYRDGYPNKRQKPYPIPDLTNEEIFFLDWTEPENKTNLRKQRFNSSYDNAMVRISARRAWQQVRDIPWWSGQFRWTGHDYLGEGGYVHGGWPFRAFMGGAIDLCNFEKDLYYLYQSQWTEAPMVHILPHWTHPTMPEGTKIPVQAYSNADEVELFLNGKSLGRDKPGRNWDEMQCDWLVPWTPGEVKAVAYRDGKAVAEAVHRTAGAPARISLSSDTPQLAADGKDIAQVAVAQQDAAGNFYPYGENRIFFHLDGPARIKALGNGSPLDVEPHYGVNSRITFFGLAKAFVEATREAGDVTLTAGVICGEKRQITSDTVAIDVQQVALRGKLKPASFDIFYTTDGETPTRQSKRYGGPFSVALGTTVKAVVYADGAKILELKERFAEDEGFYWGRAG